MTNSNDDVPFPHESPESFERLIKAEERPTIAFQAYWTLRAAKMSRKTFFSSSLAEAYAIESVVHANMKIVAGKCKYSSGDKSIAWTRRTIARYLVGIQRREIRHDRIPIEKGVDVANTDATTKSNSSGERIIRIEIAEFLLRCELAEAVKASVKSHEEIAADLKLSQAELLELKNRVYNGLNAQILNMKLQGYTVTEIMAELRISRAKIRYREDQIEKWFDPRIEPRKR
ncbi:hypothetical protein LOC68_01675 [Blastopirellula sp. JC732]|uniref:Uncharacterized protein n=1 Tax=Blastopirellula sediminis TaxID=2894196 RepID=A0A9X1SHD4_9BACT|nr:hypothetical protein [Blastopirellula sediminis]MCC9608103.1 hypothetical protein [Blastopirellula sediminis]MCC9627104.1 hypothetical protein [Blastopirellula sediminis]